MFFFLPVLVFLCGSTAEGQVPGTSACTLNAGSATHDLNGLVKDTSGAPLADVEVAALCGSFRMSARTKGDGTYSLQLPEGTFEVTAQAPQFAMDSRRLDVTGSTHLDFTLAPAGVKTSITVNGSVEYLEQDSPVGTKTDTPLLEVPQAITVLSRQLLDDQAVLRLDDALKNVAGVTPGGYYGEWDYYRIRGFDASFNTFLDGLRTHSGTGEETFGLESIEVMKGPSSALYGQAVLGGIVDLTSKRPMPNAFANVDFTGGQFGLYSPTADLGGFLNRSHRLYARLVTLYRSENSFTDYAYSHRFYVAPSVTWRIGSATSLTLLGRFQQDHLRAAFPLPAYGTIFSNPNGQIPDSLYLGETSNGANTLSEQSEHYGYVFSHSFNDSVAFHQTARITSYHQYWDQLMYPAYLSADETTEYRYPLTYRQNWRTYGIDSTLEASFHTGRITHKLIAGYEFYRDWAVFSGETIDFSDPSAYMPINLFHPVYNAVPMPSLIPAYGGSTLVQYSGIYIQDQVHLTSRLIVSGGGRFNFATNQTEPSPSVTQYAFTPRLGVTYLLRSNLSLFGSYSQSFLPQSGQLYSASNSAGTAANPEEGHQWEVGFKSNLLSNRVNATLALFDLTRSNVLTDDVIHPGFYVLTGKQRSQGAEFETSSTIRTGWTVTAAYAYTFARVTEDNAIALGTPTQNAPRNMVSFWTRYEFQKGWWRGLGLGVGTHYYSRQAADLENSFQLPAYGLTDASISYRRGPFHVQLNAYNVGDRTWYAGSYNDLYVKPGAPRNVRCSAGWSF